MKSYRGVHTAQRQITTQVPIEFCIYTCYISVCVSVSVLITVSVNEPKVRIGSNLRKLLDASETCQSNYSRAVFWLYFEINANSSFIRLLYHDTVQF